MDGDIPYWECVQLLEANSCGRVVIMSSSGFPMALPVSYGVMQDDQVHILMHVGADGEIARACGPAGFEIDRIDHQTGHATSIVVCGELSPIDEPVHRPTVRPWPSSGRAQWMELRVSSMSGRRFRLRTSDYAVEWEPCSV